MLAVPVELQVEMPQHANQDGADLEISQDTLSCPNKTADDMKRLQRLMLVVAKLWRSVVEPVHRNKIIGSREVVGVTIRGTVIDSNGGLWCER